MSRPGQLVVGVDPGGRFSGVCAVAADGTPVWWRLCGRDDSRSWHEYVLGVVDAVFQASVCDAYVTGEWRQPWPVAVEGLVPPNPHLGLSNVKGVLDTAQVLGVLRLRFPEAVLVDPAKHGGNPLAAYPPELRGPRERGGNLSVGTGKLRHVRSAYDIAQTYRLLTKGNMHE